MDALPDPIPPLELLFHVAQLGGWGNVAVLTHIGVTCDSGLMWLTVGDLHEYYLDPNASAGFRVYDVRRHTEKPPCPR